MIRHSQVSKLAAQARYIVDHKKPVVSMPKKNPPKYIYKVAYKPSSQPGLDLGFPDHEYMNPFSELAGNKFEQFRYEYAGQWWEEYTFLKIVAALSPLFAIFMTYYSMRDNYKTRKQDCISTFTIDILLDKGFVSRAI